MEQGLFGIPKSLKFRLVLADPPWHFVNWSADAPGKTHNRSRGAAKWYPTETLDTLKSMAPPVERDAILLLWAISSHLPDALELMSAWGFTYKSVAWVWVKITRSFPPRVWLGMGYYLRQCTELCLLGVRGSPPRGSCRNEPAVIFAPRGEAHSSKPPEQYLKIDRMWPDLVPRLEMFARQPREGWYVWGNEIPNFFQGGSNAAQEE